MSDLTIKASPTKEFFIHMLTRDVALARAIIDLVDNSVDGAKRLRPDNNFQGLHVEIKVNEHSFRISDNCGGIPIKVARNYAFRFGRPKDAPSTEHSVGQFGVGMKRTFFKLGKKISVSSATSTSRFAMSVDVQAWLDADDEVDDWHFRFDTLDENVTVPDVDVGTIVEVTELLAEPKQSFAQTSFLRELEAALAQDHAIVLAQGLQITLNKAAVGFHPLEILSSEEIKPVVTDKAFYPEEPFPVQVRIVAGVSTRDKEDGGWYVFCNGRMIVKADQSRLTGWGEDEGTRLPKYHPDFAFFRGYVFFECEDAGRLPWTTTKTGVDSDSWLYRTVRADMISAAKQVLGFLREMAKEREEVKHGDREVSRLEVAMNAAKPKPVLTLSAQPIFVRPALQPLPGPRMQKIQYSRSTDEIEEVKLHLGVSTLQEVGQRTFQYYLDYEVNS